MPEAPLESNPITTTLSRKTVGKHKSKNIVKLRAKRTRISEFGQISRNQAQH